MNAIHFDVDRRSGSESWVTDDEAAVLKHLRNAQLHFDAMPEDCSGELAAFDECIADAEKIIVMRLARRTAEEPLPESDTCDPDDVETQLRWLAAGERQARRESRLTAYAVIGISVFAALAAALRFSGIGG